MMIGLALLGSVQAIIVSLMIITLSGNKLEGMAVTKLSALTLLGIPVPFFIDSYYQFAVGDVYKRQALYHRSSKVGWGSLHR